jgi:hypothetical protein
VNATGGPAVNHLETRLDAGSFATATSPQTINGIADGSHTFQVRSVDSSGNASSAASFTWVVDTTAPTASISSNPANPTNQTSATFSFSGSDSGSGVNHLETKLDSGSFATATSPQTFNSLAAGSHTFQVRAVDNAGNVGPAVSDTWVIDLTNPTITSLVPNTVIVSDANVGPNGFVVTATYSEPMNQAIQPTFVFPVEVPVGSINFASSAWQDALTWQAKFDVADLGTTLPNIDVQINGGQDLAGNVQTPFTAADFVSLDTQNPIVSSITSATPNGTYGVGANIDVTLNFSEPVTLAGSLNVTLDTGAVVSIVGSASGTTLSGTYTVAAGQNSSDLNVTALALTGSSTLKDAATNNAVLSLPASNLAVNKDIVVQTPPAVASFTVNGGAVQRSRLTTITINFVSPIDASTLTGLGAITLTRTAATPAGTVGTVVQTGATGANGRIDVAPTSGLVSSVTLTFDNADGSPVTAEVEDGSLADGRWQLAIPNASFQSGLNDPTLRRLFGDTNNDGTVDGTDFGDFGTVFGATLANSPFDFNTDGTVDGTDFGEFGTRFGLTL